VIDHTSSRIEQQQADNRRALRRRYAFHTMLKTTDRLLWRMEELNRDGVKTVPRRVRDEIRDAVDDMPSSIREPRRETVGVQDTLDSLFEIQERLFRWRSPDWHDWDPDEGLESAAS
jgi:hypothetical protein